MRIERHVFGSFSGYTTLARSAGLSADESRFLEGAAFSFGQTSDNRYLKSLRKYAAWFTRNLRSGRRGLTRVLEGTPDDNGRPTLLMVTAIVTQREWDSELCGDVQRLLDDAEVWNWEGGQLLPIDRVFPLPNQSVPRKSVPRLLALLSEVERQFAGARQSVVVSAGDFGQEELAALEMLIPPMARPGFTAACRSLSAGLQVNVNCLAAEADSQAVTFRPQPGAAMSPYSQFLQGTSFAAGVLPLAEVMSYRTFGKREAAGPLTVSAATMASMPAPIVIPAPRGTSKGLVAILILMCFLMGGAGFFLGRRLGATQATTGQVAQASLGKPQTSSGAANPASPTRAATDPATDPAIGPQNVPATRPEHSGAARTSTKTLVQESTNHGKGISMPTTRERPGDPSPADDQVGKDLEEAKRHLAKRDAEIGHLKRLLAETEKKLAQAQHAAQSASENARNEAQDSYIAAANAYLAALLPVDKKSSILVDQAAAAAPTLAYFSGAIDLAAAAPKSSPDAAALAKDATNLKKLVEAAQGLRKGNDIQATIQSLRKGQNLSSSDLDKIEGAIKLLEDAVNRVPDEIPYIASPATAKWKKDLHDFINGQTVFVSNHRSAQKSPTTKKSGK